jgi:hypothetical protein
VAAMKIHVNGENVGNRYFDKNNKLVHIKEAHYGSHRVCDTWGEALKEINEMAAKNWSITVRFEN